MIHLTVETVPRIANVNFAFEDQTFVTDADGIGKVEVTKPGTYDIRVLDASDTPVSEDTRITFSRWADSTFQPERTVELRGDKHLQVGFDVYHRVGLSFTSLSDSGVDADRISLVTLKRSDGSYFTFEDSQPQWLMSTRVVRRKEGLEASPLLYSVESVMVDGTNAVNRYQQRYYVEPEDTWEIQLLLYAIRIHANDALFGFSVGDSVALHFPDGHIEELQFGENQDVSRSSLARGQYHVQVQGASGMTPLTPIALSRDQEVALKVLTALDIGSAVISAATVALALLIYKRPNILTVLFGLFRRKRKPLLQPAATYNQISGTPDEQVPYEPEPVLTSTSGEVNETPDEQISYELEPVLSATSDQVAETPSEFLSEESVPAQTVVPSPVVQVAVIPKFDKDPCIASLIEHFHPDGFRCPHCHHTEARITRENRRSGLKVYHCSNCQQDYNLYTGTPFAGSHLTPVQSERLLHGVLLDPAQLAEELGITKKTVRKWQQRLQTDGELPKMKPSVEHEEVSITSEENER